ncbi:alpha/beta hydrolase [Nocardiopsis exhalans]|uniref:Pimeloyl-ACP methyl ester carboxylesterase n=2 Tax=Nocardiopsis TaxID=2013 RepID=A0A840WFU1_9ACTN|nr:MULTISPECIES: alpha/beta hydrolase [Nocardiopsis]MBB5494293.1 pimeloyl-ACP methyl ester carboxylesterase [Nocardiopsis metallicus]USY20614.1 alpha/beta hydrolase [Nocardiopsis exhalans]
MTEAAIQGARVYRSEAAERLVRGWCEERLAEFTDLEALPRISTAIGPTRAFRFEGGSGAPVVVLSGTNFNSALSASPASDMTAERDVLLVDLPGQPGLSCGKRPRGHRARAYGAWFDEVLPELVDRPAIVLGHSLGAAVALASRPCSLVKGLVLVNPAGLTPAATSPELMRVTLPWMIGPREDKSTRLLNFMSGPSSRYPVHPFAHWMTMVGRYCRTSLAPGPLDTESLLAWQEKNVTVATGSDDVFFSPARLHGPARRFLNTGTHVLEGAGHLAPYEFPDKIRELVCGADS